jgi:hypothetical protein
MLPWPFNAAVGVPANGSPDVPHRIFLSSDLISRLTKVQFMSHSCLIHGYFMDDPWLIVGNAYDLSIILRSSFVHLSIILRPSFVFWQTNSRFAGTVPFTCL